MIVCAHILSIYYARNVTSQTGWLCVFVMNDGGYKQVKNKITIVNIFIKQTRWQHGRPVLYSIN